jgi:hypothetical protein
MQSSYLDRKTEICAKEFILVIIENGGHVFYINV